VILLPLPASERVPPLISGWSPDGAGSVPLAPLWLPAGFPGSPWL